MFKIFTKKYVETIEKCYSSFGTLVSITIWYIKFNYVQPLEYLTDTFLVVIK